jgi:hypothetical protein
MRFEPLVKVEGTHLKGLIYVRYAEPVTTGTQPPNEVLFTVRNVLNDVEFDSSMLDELAQDIQNIKDKMAEVDLEVNPPAPPSP